MVRGFPWHFTLLLAFTLAQFLGCESAGNMGDGGASATGSTSTSNAGNDDLRSFRQVYLDYHDVNGKGPESWEAALEFAGQSDAYDPEAIQRLRDAGYRVTWGASVRDAVDGADRFVIAEAASGRPKLMISGLIED